MTLFKYLTPILKPLCIFLLLPLVFNHAPLVVYHQNTFYWPIFFHYTEQDIGGKTTLLLDFKDPYTQSALSQSFAIYPPYPHGLTPDTTLPQSITAPSAQHWLGTNINGQDILVYTVYALIIQICAVHILTYISATIGVTIGTFFAYHKHLVDIGGQWLTEICRSIPLTLLVVVCQYQTPYLFIGLFALTQWTKYASLARTDAYNVQHRPFVLDAIFSDTAPFKSILSHALHSSQSQLPHTYMNYFAIITSLDYFGLRLWPQYPSLGQLIVQAQHHPNAMWMILTCCSCFFLINKEALQLRKNRQYFC